MRDLHGADLREADLRKASLSRVTLDAANLHEADLGGANFHKANLHGADLGGARLGGAGLFEADLREADLSKAILIEADLSGAILIEADLRDADLRDANLPRAALGRAHLGRANFSNANLRQANLINARLNSANLTGAKLWETQRSGWSIKGIVCQRAFWDRAGKEPTEYGEGEFERLFTEKPRIVLRYQGGMSPVDLLMLPLIVERLQAEHPDCALQVRSIQDEGNGATVVITVDDLANRSTEVFASEIDALNADLTTLQYRLQHEQELRLTLQAKYQAVVEDVLPMLVKRAMPKQINIGQITGPTVVDGRQNIGRDVHVSNVTTYGGIDLPKLAEELGRLRAAMKREPDGPPEQDEAVGAIAAAEKTAAKGDTAGTLQHLKNAGKWALGIAEKISVSVASKAIEKAMTGI